MNKFLKFLIHFILFSLFVVGLGRKIDDVTNDKGSIFVHNSDFGGRYKYLTSLDMLLQLIFFGISTINSLIDLTSNKNILYGLCNFLFRSLVFPFGNFVAMTFWIIYIIDRQLVFPTEYDAVIPPWHNHIMHTVPLVGAFIESYITKHKYPKSLIIGALPSILAGITYLIWVLIVAKYGGFWVYPVMEVLSPYQRLSFFFGLSLLLAGLYKLGDFFNNYFWSSKNKQTKIN